jgi:hypothetical protein
LSCYTR